MERGAIAGMIFLDRAGTGQDPVPVQDRHIVGLAGVGMPAEEMVVKLADLSGLILMADVVKVGLRPGRVDQAQDQQDDPQSSEPVMITHPPSHRFV